MARALGMGRVVTSARCREIERRERFIAQQDRELDHRADVISTQADRIAELEGELAEAIECGAHFAYRPAVGRARLTRPAPCLSRTPT